MLMNLSDFLLELLRQPGVSGAEAQARDFLASWWQPLADELLVSPIGTLTAWRRGTAPPPRQRILFAAHLDTIGMMVSQVEGEFLHIAPIGGLDPRVLPGQPVTVWAKDAPLPGLLVAPPDRLLPPENRGKPVPLSHLLIDLGLTARQVARRVHIGDRVTFAQPPQMFGQETIVGPGLDNRASIAALTLALEALQGRTHTWDAYFAATVQEEENLGGAKTIAYELRPHVAVAVDVSFATGPGVSEDKGVPLGEGVLLGFGPNIHPKVHQAMKAVADRLEIPYTIDYLPTHSGTDAMALQIAAAGAATMVLSIPLRYMHTPVEMVSLKDIRRAGRLLAEFVVALDEQAEDWLQWED